MSELRIKYFDSVRLEGGFTLRDVDVAYRTWGELNESRDNVIVVFHSLTGDSNAADWWAPMIGPGRALDTSTHFVVCINLLGSCYGTTGPTSIDPGTGKPYANSFPIPTVRDNVALQRRLLDELGVTGIEVAIGGSLGGMIALEWALMDRSLKRVVAVATSGRHSAWCIAWSEAQRQAIYADPNWNGGNYSVASPPRAGLATARMIAMLSYRNQISFSDRFGRDKIVEQEAFSVESYLRHQGKKLVDRFDANCYVRLSQTTNSHDLARGRGLGRRSESVQRPESGPGSGQSEGNYERVLASIEQEVLVVGISSDVLFPVVEQEELAFHIPRAELEILDSTHGHDAFLLEAEHLNRKVKRWLRKTQTRRPKTVQLSRTCV